jgi:hypothetical protein
MQTNSCQVLGGHLWLAAPALDSVSPPELVQGENHGSYNSFQTLLCAAGTGCW